jgi:DNA repair protein RecN (Recombination protein N)
MLRFLSIRNLAVIDRLELEFEPGLNVLTGETGAGKSILVGAVGLLVGGRASAELVRTGEDQAAIEAIFEDPAGGELVVRRDISSQSGRSRAFMNGALVTSAALRDAAAELVDLHGQHEHQVLLDPASHLDLLDAFAGLEAEREKVSEAFARVQALTAERDQLAIDLREKARREEYLQFQLTELRRAAPKPGEDEELSTSRQVLANAERLQRLCAEAYTGLYEGDGAALTALAAVWKRVGELASIDPQFQPYVLARDAVKPQLEDLAYFLRSYSAAFDASPVRLQEVEDRLAVLERLKKKPSSTLRGRPTSSWRRRCPRNARLPRRRSAPGSSPRWPIWRCPVSGARCGSLPHAGPTPGPPGAWTRPSSTSRRIPARIFARSRGSRQAANCRG